MAPYDRLTVNAAFYASAKRGKKRSSYKIQKIRLIRRIFYVKFIFMRE